jgi:nucleoside-diphosphate-sugar epimerase
MRVLLTGASGFVGGYLAPALVEAGHEVFALVRDPGSYAAPDAVRAVEADLESPLDEASLPEVDAVAHFAQANVPFPDQAPSLYRVNTGSTLELLDFARRTGAERFLYASSASVYGFGEEPFAEDDPVSAHDFYATTKAHSEQLVGAYSSLLRTATFRLVAPYGPGQRGRMIPGVIARVRDGRPVTLNDGGRPRMNPIYVSDAVKAVVATLALDDSVVVNVAGDEVVGIREIAVLAGEALGAEPVFEDGGRAAAGDLIAGNARLHQLFGLEQLVSPAEGIRRMVEAESAVEAPA